MEPLYEWDPIKAAKNFRKHGITFETAVESFTDPFAIVEQDRVAEGEERWQLIGMTEGLLLVLVAYTFRGDTYEDGTEVTRLISARRANRIERRRYDHDLR